MCRSRSDAGNTSMALSRSQRGFITFSGLVLLLVVAAILFASYKLLPPYIDNYQLQDSMENIARTATYNRLTEAEIRSQVLSEAQELGIPLDERQVVVQRSGNSVDIAVQYYIPVDLLVHQMELRFAPFAGNRNIMAK